MIRLMGFGAAVGDAAGVEVGQHLGSPGPQGAAEAGDFGDGAGVEGVEDLLGQPAAGGLRHVWRPSRHGLDRQVTAMVDLTRDADGCIRARLLDVVPDRSGTAYKAWLAAQRDRIAAGVEHAALDPFRGYANAIRDELHDAVAVLDAFHVVRLGTAVVDEVHRRVQQQQLGHRGHRDDPLYRIRGLADRAAGQAHRTGGGQGGSGADPRRHHRVGAGPPPRRGLAHALGRRGHQQAGRPGPAGRCHDAGVDEPNQSGSSESSMGGGSWASENVEVGHARSAQRQMRLRQASTVGVPKHGASCARCSRRPCTTATTPQVGQPVTVLVGLDREHQPALGMSHREQVHPRHVEQGVDPGTPPRPKPHVQSRMAGPSS